MLYPTETSGSRVLRSNCFGPNSSHSSLRLEQVKELVTAVAMAAPTVISMVSTPPRATNQAAREHLVGSSQALVNSRSLRMFIQSIAGCHPSLPIPFAVQNPDVLAAQQVYDLLSAFDICRY